MMSISQRFSDLAIISKTVVNYMKLNKDFVVCNSNIQKVIYCGIIFICWVNAHG